MKKPLRVYADTSVFGGCFDDEFKIESARFFEEARQGRFIVVISNVTVDELELAPEQVRGVAAGLPPEAVEIVGASEESNALSQAYLDAKVGLKGKYDFTLHWVADAIGAPQVSTTAAEVDAGPDLFQTLQQQLGLKLESKKGLVKILVVDHAGKMPAEN